MVRRDVVKLIAALLVICYACFTPVGLFAGLMWLHYRTISRYYGTKVPDIATGHVYALDVQGFHSPKLVMYVTHAEYTKYVTADTIYDAWIVATLFFVIVAAVAGALGYIPGVPKVRPCKARSAQGPAFR